MWWYNVINVLCLLSMLLVYEWNLFTTFTRGISVVSLSMTDVPRKEILNKIANTIWSATGRDGSHHLASLKKLCSDQTDRVKYIFYFLYSCNIIFYIIYMFLKKIVGWERLQRNSFVWKDNPLVIKNQGRLCRKNRKYDNKYSSSFRFSKSTFT